MSMSESAVPGPVIHESERPYLEKLRLAAGVIIDAAPELDLVADSLAGELEIFKDRLDRALLLPAAAVSASPGAAPPATSPAPDGGTR